MGLVMSPGSVVAQLNQMNQNLQEGIGNAAHALGTVTALQNTESVLIGESYDSVRAYYSTLHVPLLQGMILFAQMLIQENNNYKSCIQSHLAGIGYIDEDELERDKENIQRQINHVYSLMSVSKLSYSSYLGCLQNALALVEKKLRQIDDFLGASAGLYAGMDSYQINIRNGLKEIGGKHFDRATGKYDLAAVKLGWKKGIRCVNGMDSETKFNNKTDISDEKLRKLLENDLREDEVKYIDEIIEFSVQNRYAILNIITNEKIYIPSEVRDKCKRILINQIHEDTELIAIMQRVDMSNTGLNVPNGWDKDFISYSNCAQMNYYFRQYRMNDDDKILFLGQVYKESGGGSLQIEKLTYSEKWELLDKEYNEELLHAYIQETGKSLNNIMYRGYGPLQMTHQETYEEFANYIFEKYGDQKGSDDIKDMGVYSQSLHNNYSWESSFWFWNIYKGYIEKETSDDATHTVLGYNATDEDLSERSQITEVIREAWYEEQN